MKKLRKPRFSTRAEVIKLAALSFDQTIWFFVSASYRVYVLQNLKGNSAALQFADPGERDNLDEAEKTPNAQLAEMPSIFVMSSGVETSLAV